MTHVEVKSSNLKSVAYDPENRVLEVVFHGGGKYRYQDVPEEAYDKLLAAESVGRFFVKEIKPKFVAKKVEPELCRSCGVGMDIDGDGNCGHCASVPRG